MNVSASGFEDLSLSELRRRTSEKWSLYPAEVLPAFIAEMDFRLALPIRVALQSALDNDDCGYARTADLGPAFSHFAADRFRWHVDSSDVFPVPDVMAGVAESLRAFTAHAAPVVINPPVYPPFFEVIRTVKRTIVEVPLLYERQDGSWSLDFAGLENAFADGAAAYLLCSPHNPVGRVWSKHELERIAALAKRYDVTVLADEIHAPLVMPGVEFTPFLRVHGGLQSCVALTSASKAWNVAGLKCGVLVAGSETVRASLNDRFAAMPTELRWRTGQLGVRAAIAAFREGGPWLDELRTQLDHNRKELARLLRELIPKARYSLPQATFLAWIDCADLGLGRDPAALLLERGRVALEPGLGFGEQGAYFVRLNFATSSALLHEIVRRMAHSL